MNKSHLYIQRENMIQACPIVAQIDAQTVATPWSASDFKAILNNSANNIWLLFSHQIPIGMVAFSTVPPESELLKIAILPEYQGNSLGTFLLSELIKHLKDIAVRTLLLEVNTANQIALNLYTRLQFKTIGQRKKYYADKEDALVMRLNIS